MRKETKTRIMNRIGFIILIVFASLIAFYFLVLKPEKFIESDIYDDIMDRGYIKVGINTDSKPFGFYNEKGELCGYDADLARYIAQYFFNNRKKAVFVPVTTNNRLIKASTGEVDIVIATLTITPQRMQVIDFSIPYDSAGQSILVKTGSKVSSLGDLAGENVGVVWGTTAEKNMLNTAPSANIIGFKTYNDAYKALKNGQITALTSDDTILRRFSQEDKGVTLIPKRYSREPYGIGFKKGKGSDKLKHALDNAITDLKQKNVINRLHKQWLGDSME